MKNLFRPLPFILVLASACEDASESNAQQGSGGSDRLAQICLRSCQINEDLCEPPGSTQASGQSCVDRCQEQFEFVMATEATTENPDGTTQAPSEECRGSFLDLYACHSSLSCAQQEETDSLGNPVHCRPEMGIAIDACSLDEGSA